MAYTAATATSLKARFPAFVAVADDTVTAALMRARRSVDDSWLEDDRAEGEMLLAAHEMTLDGFGTGTEAQLAGQGALGFTRMKSGQLELERAATASAGSVLGQTSYGQRFMRLARLNVGGPRVTGAPT